MSFVMGCALLLAGMPAFGADDSGLRGEVEQLRALVTQQQAALAKQDQRLATQDQQIAQMRQQTDGQWMSAQRVDQIKTLVREVLSDADTRASLMDSAITAGHNGSNFFLASEDGNFMLKIKGMVQARYTFGHQEKPSPVAAAGDASGDENRGSFGITRSRFGFVGHVIDPSWQYAFWAGYDCSGAAVVLDAYITKVLDANWSVTAGQFKLPFMYEYLVSETSLQFIERSLVAGEFCGTYTQGVMVTYQDDMFRARLSFNDGASTINSTWSKRDTEVALTGRGEVKVMGDWKDYNDWEGWNSQNPLLVFGVAAHWQIGEYGTTDSGEIETLRWTVDGSLEQPGWNIFAAVTGQHDSRGRAADALAVVLQGGAFVTDDIELIARYEWSDGDTAANDDLSLVTVGMNYFFSKHALKYTVDVGYAFNGVGSIFESTPLGWRQDAAGADGQIVVRTQVQLLF